MALPDQWLDERGAESYPVDHLALASGTACMRGVGFNKSPSSAAWPDGGSEMGARVRAKDWSKSPLGAPDAWPQSVRVAVSICLNSRFPILLWIGPDLRLIYNDPYIPFLGEKKHQSALG